MIEPQKQEEISEWEQRQAKNARHRALIMQILKSYPGGLTTQEIVTKEAYYYGYTFLTDNRLRELRKLGWVECTDERPMRWKPVNPKEKIG